MPLLGPYRRSPLKSLDGVSRDELQMLIEHLVERNPSLTEQVNARLDQMRAAMEKMANAASKIELSAEQIELLQKLEAQYLPMKSILERYEISTNGMPTWEQVKKGLTPEILDKVSKLAEPALLLLPPTLRQSKVEAIDRHPAKYQYGDTFIQKFEKISNHFQNNDFWNGGRSKAEKKWSVSIVDGVQNVGQDSQIYDGKRTNHEMAKLWVQKYKDQGLDVINNADTYLVLFMKALAEGKPIDTDTFTVLNGKSLKKPSSSSYIAKGDWRNNRVNFFLEFSGGVHINLRLRSLVGVDIG